MNRETCERAEMLLSARLDRSLSAEEAAELESHLGTCQACREAGEEMASACAAFTAALRAEPIRRRDVAAAAARTEMRRWAWVAGAAAALLLALGAWFYLRDQRVTREGPQHAMPTGPQRVTPTGPRLAKGTLSEGGQETRELCIGRRYRAGDGGARIELAANGALEVTAGSTFILEQQSWRLVDGSLRAWRLGGDLVAAGKWEIGAGEGSAGMDYHPDLDEVAVVSLRGGVTMRTPSGVRTVAPGLLVAQGWGLADEPLPLEQAEEALQAKRQSLASPERARQYREIVSQYQQRIETFRQERAKHQVGSPEFAELREREDSLLECKGWHDEKVPVLDQQVVERRRIERRVGFLELARRWLAGDGSSLLKPSEPSATSADPSPDGFADGGVLGALAWSAR